MTKEHYVQYTSDESLINQYNDYQQSTYANEPSERDRVSIKLLSAASQNGSISLIDYACSTGNFLRHFRKQIPEAKLMGVDLAEKSILHAKTDPSLEGIEFVVADILNFAAKQPFSAANASAVFSLMNDEDVSSALKAIRGNLESSGVLVGFEWLHPWPIQQLKITETNEWNPDGLTIYMRPQKLMGELLRTSGFQRVTFHEFMMPFALPMPDYDGDVRTYTRQLASGEQLSFRGALYQPWCHYVAHCS